MCVFVYLKTENTGMVRSELPRSVCVFVSDCTPFKPFFPFLSIFSIDCGEYVFTSPFDFLFDHLANWETGANDNSV